MLNAPDESKLILPLANFLNYKIVDNMMLMLYVSCHNDFIHVTFWYNDYKTYHIFCKRYKMKSAISVKDLSLTFRHFCILIYL